MPAGRAVKTAIKNALGLSGVRQVSVLAGPAKGVKMELDFSGHTPMYLGMYEWELHRFFDESLRGARMVFDVGGHLGYDALMAAANMPGQVVTFEMEKARARALQANVDRNPALADRIVVRAQAVGAAEGPGVTTLDALSATVGPPDFIKIDIDGGETDALRGALATLKTARPHLIVETHSLELENECGTLLVECGYAPIIKHNRKIWREYRAEAPHNRWLLAAGTPRGPFGENA